MKSLNSAEVYCGPPSETIMFGTLSSAKTAFISWTKTLDVVLPSLHNTGEPTVVVYK